MKKLLAILISVMLLAGSCAFAEGATGEIIFGLTAPVTGSQAAGGEQAQKGMELAIEEVNNAGGITLSDGTTYTITLLVEDDQGDSTLCDTTVRRLVSNCACVL